MASVEIGPYISRAKEVYYLWTLMSGHRTIVSQGLEANYMDIINYAIFALIRLDESKKENKSS
jgi:hypothetical protein